MKSKKIPITTLFLLTGCGGIFGSDSVVDSSYDAGQTFSLSAASSGDGQVTLEWRGSISANSYTVTYGTSSGTYGNTFVTGLTGTSSVVTGLTNGTTYYFMVTALVGRGSLNSSVELSAKPLPTATFNGWTHIKAVGPKRPVAQATDISSASASVTLTWPAMALSSGSIVSYNIYRSSSSGGQNYTSPLATGISTTNPTYTDSTAAAGTTYYYTVAPVIANGNSVVIATTTADLEAKVIVPKDNMVLLHRWAANIEMCGTMGRATDRSNNYRCTVATGSTAPPGTAGSGYVDLGDSIFVDAFEQGCNYTYSASANKCGSANGCIGILSDPNGLVTGNAGDVYYSRRSSICYFNTSVGTGTSWVAANVTSAANRQLMGSGAPGLPPFVFVDQAKSQEVCSGQTVSGFAGNKRLMRRKEQMLVSAWDASLDDATIATIETGLNLHSTRYCNSSFASPQGNNAINISGTFPTLAFSNAVIPSALDTLPGCLDGDCAGNGSADIRQLRTGSNFTDVCVSRYGAQDLIGNVWEWTSDQVSCTGASCTGVNAASNTIDLSNNDFSGIAFNNVQGPTASNVFSNWGRVQFPLGIPIANAGFTGDGWISLTAAQLRGDIFSINVAAATRGALAGGGWIGGGITGRFALSLSTPTTYTFQTTGLRCVLPAE